MWQLNPQFVLWQLRRTLDVTWPFLLALVSNFRTKTKEGKKALVLLTSCFALARSERVKRPF